MTTTCKCITPDSVRFTAGAYKVGRFIRKGADAEVTPVIRFSLDCAQAIDVVVPEVLCRSLAEDLLTWTKGREQ